jgi:hypothetical protein
MKHRLTRIACGLAMLGLSCLAPAGQAGEGTESLSGEQPTPITSADIILGDGGVLHGAMVSPEAQPVKGVKVHVRSGDRIVATTTTDDRGRFEVRGLRKGLHSIQAGNQQQIVRFWDEQSAPPKALRSLAIVSGDRVVRGQAGLGGLIGAGGGAGIGGVGLGTVGLAVAGATGTVMIVDEATKDTTPGSP